MSLVLLISSVGLACTSGPPAFSDNDRQSVAAEVRATMGALTAAMNAFDADSVVSFYTDRSDFVYLGCTEFVTGGETFKRLVQPFYGPNDPVTFEQTIVAVQALSPTIAVVFQQGSSTRSEDLFWTQGLVKEGGRWRITFEHESWAGCSPPRAPHPFTAPGDSAGLLPGGIAN